MPFHYSVGAPSVDETSSLRQYAFDMLYRAIYDGTLLPDEELSEQELVTWLQMSRQPIRYALLHLEDLGLVVLSTGRSPRIAPYDPARINRTIHVTAMIHTYVVDRITGTLTAHQRAELDAVTASIRDADAAEDWTALAEGIYRFWKVLTGALGNELLIVNLDRMSYEVSRFLRPGASLVEPRSLAAPTLAIGDAVATGDRACAVAATRALYAVTEENFLTRFREESP